MHSELEAALAVVARAVAKAAVSFVGAPEADAAEAE